MVGNYRGKSSFSEYQIKRIALPRNESGALTGVADPLIDEYVGSDDTSRLDRDQRYSGTVDADVKAPVLRAGGHTVDSGVASITTACGAGIGGVAGRVASVGKTKLVVLMSKRDRGSVIVRAVGASRREYSTTDAEGTTNLRIEVPISNELEVGFSAVHNVLCHWASTSTVAIEREHEHAQEPAHLTAQRSMTVVHDHDFHFLVETSR